MALFFILIIAGSSVWVLADSSNIGARRDSTQGMAGTTPGAWFVGCILFWIVCFPLYLSQREKIKELAASRERAARSVRAAPHDEKVCPRCAETIKQAAVACRYCGHEFEPVP